jgi:nucleoside-diphosphate-sugar epimerase
LGSALCEALTDEDGPHHRDSAIRVLARDQAERDHLDAISPRLDVVVGSVAVAEDVERLLDGAGSDTDVIHAAAVIHPARAVAEFETVNVNGTSNVVRSALAVGVRRLVHVSSNSPLGTNPDPLDVFRADEPYHPYLGYGHSKMRAELAVLEAHASGLDTVIVRPPWFYGPWQPARQTTFFRLVRQGRFPVFGGGHQRRSMVYVGNLVDGVLAAELTEGVSGRAFWIADERPYEVAEIVATVQQELRALGLESKQSTLRVPNVVATVAERVDRALQARGRYHQQIHVLGEMNKTIACDIGASRAALGYYPTVGLAEGMRRSIVWCLDRGLEL